MATTYATLADPVSAVVDLLSNNWSEVASGVGTTPTIDESWDIGRKKLKNGDIIRCYETASSHEFLGIGKGIDKHNATITIDIATAEVMMLNINSSTTHGEDGSAGRWFGDSGTSARISFDAEL